MSSTITTLRRELTAALRLAVKFEYHEGICNHFSVVVPRELCGGVERYLINPYGVHWAEMRPDQLLLIDGEGNIHEGDGEVEATARNIHIAGHRANPRHQCILHVHMPYATSITMVEGGRLEMAHQTATRFYGRMAHHSFGGLALDENEGERIAEAQKKNLTLTSSSSTAMVSRSVPQASRLRLMSCIIWSGLVNSKCWRNQAARHSSNFQTT